MNIREYGLFERLRAVPLAEVEYGGMTQLMTLESVEFLQAAGVLIGAKVTFRNAGVTNQEIEGIIAESEKLQAEWAAKIALFERDKAKIEATITPYLDEPREMSHGSPMDAPTHGSRMLPLQGPYSISETATPLGFRNNAEWRRFSSSIHGELARRGISGVVIIGGSAVTGHSFESGAPFDKGRRAISIWVS